MAKKIKNKNIYIPHLNYTVKIRQAVTPPDELNNAKAWVQSEGQHGCTMYLDLKRGVHPGDLSHELVHVLQFICINRNIEFRMEHEHMGYLMHYLFGQVMGYEWQ